MECISKVHWDLFIENGDFDAIRVDWLAAFEEASVFAICAFLISGNSDISICIILMLVFCDICCVDIARRVISSIFHRIFS